MKKERKKTAADGDPILVPLDSPARIGARWWRLIPPRGQWENRIPCHDCLLSVKAAGWASLGRLLGAAKELSFVRQGGFR